MLKKVLLISGLFPLILGSTVRAADGTDGTSPGAVSTVGNLINEPVPAAPPVAPVTAKKPAMPKPPPLPTRSTSNFEAVRASLEAQLRQLAAEQALEREAEALSDRGKVSEDNLTAIRDRIATLQNRIVNLRDQAAKQGKPLTNVTFLGLATTQVPPELSGQLKLSPGFGLMVQTTTAGSAADTAGIKKYDVLTKLDDQLLIAPVQLETLIRSHQAGDEVKITYIHEGETKTTTTRLTMNQGPGTLEIAKPVKVRLLLPQADGTPGNVETESISFDDGKHMLFLDDKQNLRAVDNKTGQMIFEGPVATNDQKAGLPEQFRPALKQLEEEQHTLKSSYASTLTTTGYGSVETPMPSPSAVSILPGKITLEIAGAATQPATIVSADSMTLTLPHKSVLLWSGNSHTLALTLMAGQPDHLLATDTDGKTLFDGPVQTAEQQQRIPAEVRDGFDLLRQHPDLGRDLLK